MRVGEWRVRTIASGRLRLDGGAMFGSVPRVLWSREHAPDEKNRIDLAMRCLLLEGHGRRVLIDVGAGDKWSDKLRSIFALEGGTADLVRGLADAGVEADAITDVVLTHLHFDHAGGVSRLDEHGRAHLTFPDATHWVQDANLVTATAPNRREKASYLPENVLPVAGGKVERLEGGAEIAPGLEVLRADGHTEGMQVVRLGDGRGRGGFVYGADLVPTRSHVRMAYTMGYDLCPGLLMEEKADVLAECVANDRVLIFEHDPLHDGARLVRDDDGDFALGETVVVNDEA